MKKKIIATLMSALFLIAAVGCGKSQSLEIEEGASVQEELVQMINTDLPSIASNRDEAVAIYNKYFENEGEIDSETWRQQLEDEALTKYDTYLADLNGLVYTNSEVVNLKSLFTKSADAQRDAIECVVDSIKDMEPEKLDQAQQSIDDSKTYLKMYEDELKNLCEKYNINMVGEFQSGTSGDAEKTD